MAHRTREITDQMCYWFADDMKALTETLHGVIARHIAFEEDVWLGGDRDADNTEKAPKRCADAMKMLRAARDLLHQADSEVALFRAEIAPVETEDS